MGDGLSQSSSNRSSEDAAWPRGALKRVHVVVNPASGRNRAMLGALNEALLATGVEWSVTVTLPNVAVSDQIASVLEQGIDALVVYGGDGTIAEAASALAGRDVPLAVLPGGTSNALAVSQGIPLGLHESLALLTGNAPARLRSMDLGVVNGRCFLVAVGVGIPGAWAASTAREQKLRFGTLAYLANSLQALGSAEVSRYSLMLDGAEVVTTGVTCIIANSGSFGLPGIHLSPTIRTDDGLLDVIVIRDTDIASIVSLAASVLQREESARMPLRPSAGFHVQAEAPWHSAVAAPLQYWQASEVYLTADPAQAAQADGEVLPEGPIVARVQPRALRIVAPHRPG